MTETIDITPAPVVRARVEAYMKAYDVKADEVFAHITGRLTDLSTLAQALREAHEAETGRRGVDFLAGFAVATVAVEKMHQAISEEFLALWRPMPEAEGHEHSGRVSTPSNNDYDGLVPVPYEVWFPWGGERETIVAMSGLDAISRYAVRHGYVRYDALQELLDSVEINENGITTGVYENGTICARLA